MRIFEILPLLTGLLGCHGTGKATDTAHGDTGSADSDSGAADTESDTDTQDTDTCTESAWYADADGDGFGDASAMTDACDAPEGYAADATDCDDTRADIHPGAEEICVDGVVNDCDDADGTAALAFCSGSGPFSLSGADAVLIGEEREDGVGISITDVGDVNGEGRDDLLVGTDVLERRGDSFLSSILYLVSGPVTGVVSLRDADADLVLPDSPMDGFGLVNAGVGDTNGDGYADLLLGVWDDLNTAYLVSGPLSGEVDVSEADTQIVGEGRDGDELGSANIGPGDVDGDGLSDLLIGAPSANWDVQSTLGYCADDLSDPKTAWEEELSAGGVYLFLGSQAGILGASDAEAQFIGEDADDGVGFGLARAGDLDGDGLADLYLGARGNCEGGYNAGAAYEVLSPFSGDLSLADADAKIVGEANQELGPTAGRSGAGDTNGDGTLDLLVSITSTSIPVHEVLLLFLSPVAGSVSESDSEAEFTLGTGDSYFKFSVSSAGDIDADGFDDLVCGADDVSTGGRDAGAVYVLFGPFSGTISLADAGEIFIGDAYDSAGYSVAGVGDEDGDGLPDILVGAPGDDNEGGAAAGAAFLLLGGGALLGGTGAI